MSLDHFPVGQQMQVVYPVFTVHLTLHSTERMTFEIKEGPYASVETVDIEVAPLGHGTFAVSWKESNGAAVVNVQNYDLGIFHSFVALPDGNFWRMKGHMTMTHPAARQARAHPG